MTEAGFLEKKLGHVFLYIPLLMLVFLYNLVLCIRLHFRQRTTLAAVPGPKG